MKHEPSGAPRNRGYGPDGYCVHCHERITRRGDKWVALKNGKEECE